MYEPVTTDLKREALNYIFSAICWHFLVQIIVWRINVFNSTKQVIDITDHKWSPNLHSSGAWKNWLTGFIDGEGCFSVSFTKRQKLSFGVEVRPSFSVAQSDKRIPIQKRKKVLEIIKQYFRCGNLRTDRSTGMVIYETRNVTDIATKILPHFDIYPLLTVKNEDFESFKKIIILMRANQHVNKQGLQIIIDTAFKMNPSGKRKNTKETLLKIIENKVKKHIS